VGEGSAVVGDRALAEHWLRRRRRRGVCGCCAQQAPHAAPSRCGSSLVPQRGSGSDGDRCHVKVHNNAATEAATAAATAGISQFVTAAIAVCQWLGANKGRETAVAAAAVLDTEVGVAEQ